MTDNVINFKQAKKRAGYAKKEAAAQENRTKFGRKKSEKIVDEFNKRQEHQNVDNHKLDDDYKLDNE